VRATDRTSRCPDSRSMFWHGILDEACSYLKQLGSLMILPAVTAASPCFEGGHSRSIPVEALRERGGRI